MTSKCDPERPRPNSEDEERILADANSGTLFRFLDYIDGRMDRTHDRIDMLQFWIMAGAVGILLSSALAVVTVVVTLTHT
jgi:hypothetical protein